MSRNQLFAAAVSEVAFSQATRMFGDSERKQYFLFRTLLEVVQHPPCRRKLKCLPAPKLPKWTRIGKLHKHYQSSFNYCWSQIPSDEQVVVHGQLLRYLYSVTVFDRQDFKYWLRARPNLASFPEEAFYQLSRLPLINETNFLAIWNVISRIPQLRLLAIWWRVIKCAAVTITREKLPGVTIWTLELPNQTDKPPIQLASN